MSQEEDALDRALQEASTTVVPEPDLDTRASEPTPQQQAAPRQQMPLVIEEWQPEKVTWGIWYNVPKDFVVVSESKLTGPVRHRAPFVGALYGPFMQVLEYLVGAKKPALKVRQSGLRAKLPWHRLHRINTQNYLIDPKEMVVPTATYDVSLDAKVTIAVRDTPEDLYDFLIGTDDPETQIRKEVLKAVTDWAGPQEGEEIVRTEKRDILSYIRRRDLEKYNESIQAIKTERIARYNEEKSHYEKAPDDGFLLIVKKWWKRYWLDRKHINSINDVDGDSRVYIPAEDRIGFDYVEAGVELVRRPAELQQAFNEEEAASHRANAIRTEANGYRDAMLAKAEALRTPEGKLAAYLHAVQSKEGAFNQVLFGDAAQGIERLFGGTTTSDQPPTGQPPQDYRQPPTERPGPEPRR